MDHNNTSKSQQALIEDSASIRTGPPAYRPQPLSSTLTPAGAAQEAQPPSPSSTIRLHRELASQLDSAFDEPEPVTSTTSANTTRLPPPPQHTVKPPASVAQSSALLEPANLPPSQPNSLLSRTDSLSPSDSVSMYQVRNAGLSKRYQQQQQQEQQRYSGPHALAFAAAAEAVAAAPQSRPGHQLDPALRQSDATLYADPYTQAEAYPRKSVTYQDPYAIREVTQGDQEDDDDYYPRKSVDPYGYGYASEGQARVDPNSHGHGHSQDFSTSNLPFKRYGAGMGYAEDEDDEARQLKDGSHQPHANLFSNQMGPDRTNQYEDGADATRAGLLSKDNGKIEKQLERRRKGIYRQKYGILSFLLALVYIIIFIVELIQSKAATGQAFQTKPQLQPMLGPPFEFFINFPLGARFVPCMRNVPTRPTTQLLPCLNASTSATVTQDQLCPIWEVCRMQSATGPWQGWRFVTAIFIHAGVIHILFNVVAQLTLVVQVETILGTPAFALVYFAGGVGGNLLGGNFGLMSPALGASGAVYTAVGVEMTDLILNWHWEERRKTRLTISVVFAIVGLALGLLPGLDNFSHIGGFVCGILGGFAFGPSIHPSKKHRIGVWVVRLISGGLMLGFLLGLALNFYNSADPAQACRWCRYLSCLPAFSQCKNDGLGTTTTTS